MTKKEPIATDHAPPSARPPSPPRPAKPLKRARCGSSIERLASTRLQVSQLEQQLQGTQEQLRVATEQLDTSRAGFQLAEQLLTINGDFQSAGVSFQAANEGLRAVVDDLNNSKEELESSKEELQLLNEELIAVNRELQAKVQELHGSQLQSELQLAQLRAILDSLNDGVVISDLQGNMFLWNPAAVLMHGFSDQQQCRWRYEDFATLFELSTEEEGILPPERRPLRRILSGETLRDWEVQLRRPETGWQRIFSYSGTLARGKDGKPLLAVTSVADVTEHKRAQQDLQRAHKELERRVRERTIELTTTVETLLEEITQRERAEASLRRLNALHELLGAVDQAIVRAVDRDSLFRDFCRISVQHGGFLLAWVGLTEKASGRVRVVAASGAASYLDDIRVTANREAEGEGPTGIATREGTYYICNDFQNDPHTRAWHEKGKLHGIRASAAVALKEQGRVIGAFTLYAREKDFFDRQHTALLLQMGADISFALDHLLQETRRREAEQALQEEILERLRAVEGLRDKERLLVLQSRQAALGEMIGNIAHQWRQPLNALGLLIQEMAMFSAADGPDGGYLEGTAGRAMELVYHMSRTIDDFRNFFSPDKERMDFRVRQVIDTVISIIDASLKEQRIALEISAQGDPVVNGYPNEFSQALLNILLNARDVFAERRIDRPRIEVKLWQENGRTLLTIGDNAGGIPEEILDKIFDPYFTTKGPDKGTGIGLHMSKTIIEKSMNGRLTASNRQGGAQFCIEV
jgi:PAS domain S-box-containing protein